MLDDRNVKNAVKKFSAAKLLRRKDTFYRNLLAIVKSYHRVCVRIFTACSELHKVLFLALSLFCL